VPRHQDPKTGRVLLSYLQYILVSTRKN